MYTIHKLYLLSYHTSCIIHTVHIVHTDTFEPSNHRTPSTIPVSTAAAHVMKQVS